MSDGALPATVDHPIQHLPAALARPLIALSPLLADGLIVTAAVTPSRDST